MTETVTATIDAQTDEDPGRFFWYAVYVVIVVIAALPLFGFRLPRVFPYLPLLIIHEFAAFAYVGHTLFSNIWAMRIRMTQPESTGVWARAMLRKMALGITATTAVIVPVAGLMLVEDWGGLIAAPWAWDAYLAFWVMAAVSIVPDVIRYGRNRNSADPRHGVLSGAIRGLTALVLVIYILVCMIAKTSIFHGWFFPG